MAQLGATASTIAADPTGALHVGSTINSDVPFAIQELARVHGNDALKTINESEELVGGLPVNRAGTIFVIRSSYDRPRSTGSGLDVLSAQGNRLGTFRSRPRRR